MHQKSVAILAQACSLTFAGVVREMFEDSLYYAKNLQRSAKGSWNMAKSKQPDNLRNASVSSPNRGMPARYVRKDGKPFLPSTEHAGLGFLLCKTAHLFSGSGLAAFDQRDRDIAEPPAKSSAGALKSRILLVDAHPIVRRGMRHLIAASGDMSVCGEAATGDDAMAQISELKPDLVVLDFSLPGKSGIDLLREIKSRRPQVQILVVSRYEENIYAQRVLRAGALGYIMQREATENILSAIRRVLAGQVYVSDSVAAGALRHFAAESRTEMRHSHEVLTDRELEIFRSIGEGKSLRDIARLLKLSVNTVAAHRGHMISKLGLSGSRELLRMAMQQASEHWQGSPGSAGTLNVPERQEPTRRRNAKKR